MRLGGNVPLFRWIGSVNGAIVNVMEALRIAPRGMGDVHKMLFDTGGERRPRRQQPHTARVAWTWRAGRRRVCMQRGVHLL